MNFILKNLDNEVYLVWWNWPQRISNKYLFVKKINMKKFVKNSRKIRENINA